MRGNILIERRKYFRIKLDLAISQLHIYINFKPKRNISSFYSRVFKNKKENIEIELHSKHLFDDPIWYILIEPSSHGFYVCMYSLNFIDWKRRKKLNKLTILAFSESTTGSSSLNSSSIFKIYLYPDFMFHLKH